MQMVEDKMKYTLAALAIALGIGALGCNNDNNNPQQIKKETSPPVASSIPSTESYSSLETSTEASLKQLESKTPAELQGKVNQYRVVMSECTGEGLPQKRCESRNDRLARYKLSQLEGIYFGSVQVNKTAGGFEFEGSTPGLAQYGTPENLLRGRLRVLMNADKNVDFTITHPELDGLTLYLYQKTAK